MKRKEKRGNSVGEGILLKVILEVIPKIKGGKKKRNENIFEKPKGQACVISKTEGKKVNKRGNNEKNRTE